MPDRPASNAGRLLRVLRLCRQTLARVQLKCVATSSIGASDNTPNCRYPTSIVPSDHADELARLKKLTAQLETAQKSSVKATKDVARAKATAEKVAKGNRLLDTAKKTPTRQRRAGKKR